MMIRRRNCWISVLLAAAMLLSMLPAGVLLTQAGTDGPWSDAEVGTYRVVTATPENNLLAGLTPTGWPYNNAEVWKTKNGTDMAKLTDGALSTTGSGDYVEFELLGAGQGSGDWRQYTFDLGAAKAVQEFLLGSCGGDNAGLRECWVQVYAGSKADDLYAEAHKVAEKKHLTAAERNVLLRAAAAVEARYVGFRLYTPAGCAWGSDSEGFGIGPWYDTRRLGELGVYAERVAWSDAEVGTYRVVTAAPENNLLAGLTPTGWPYNTAEVWQTKNGTDMAKLTDGALSTTGSGDYVEFELLGAGQGSGDWRQYTFDLGSAKAVQEFLLGSCGGDNAGLRECWVQVYAGSEADDLYAEANKVAEKKNLTAAERSVLLRAATAVEARYVGFRLYTPAGCAWENDTEGFGIGPWYDTRRLGELGVYAERVAWSDAEVGTYRVVTAAPENNLLAGLTPTGWPYNTAEVWRTKNGTDMAKLTDGALSTTGSGDYVEFELLGAGQGSGDWRQYTFDLGSAKAVQEFLLGSCGGDNAGLRECWVQVYAGSEADDLYAEANKVAEKKNLTAAERSVLLRAATAVEARYVGFRLYTPAGCAWGSDSEGFGIGPWYDTRRLGELGVYGAANTQPGTNPAIRGSWLPLTENADILKAANLLTGITPTSGNSTSSLTPKDDTVLSVSTDGKLSVNGDTSSRTVFKAPTGDWLQMSYRLDAIYSLQNFVVAGSKEGSSYVPHLIRIYVGQRLSNLYTEENRVIQAEKFNVTGQEWEFFADAAKEGQYVGFEFYCPDGNKSEAEEPNAYCNGQKISAIWYECLRIGELGAYGDRVGDAPPEPVNLIAGKEPADAFQIEARGIDNKTAVSATGEVGTGNTGTLKDPVALVFEEPSSNLTDGDVDTRGATSHSVKIPLKNEYDLNYQTLQYDTPWQVLVYHLGGESRLQEIRVASAGENSSYYTAGVQYYASYRYADLFKNESLLYTTGGEYYHYDEANGIYMQDAEKDANNRRVLSYVLSDEQAAETYRFIAVVVTRPYGTYDKTYPTQRVVGYHSARMSEIVAEGTLVAPEVPPRTAYDQQTAIGNVRVQVSQLNADDIAFFDQVLGGFSFEAAALPTGIDRNTYGNWLTMDGDRMYTIRLVDKTGKALTDEQLGGRLVGITLPATAAYHQTVGRVKDGRITPMLNAYTRPDGTIQASALNYPEYHNQTSNREQAIIRSAAVSLVYLKFNDLDTINRLNGNRTDKPLQAAFVAGESRTAPSLTYLWVMAVGCGVLLAVASGWWLYRRRRSVGKGGKPV